MPINITPETLTAALAKAGLVGSPVYHAQRLNDGRILLMTPGDFAPVYVTLDPPVVTAIDDPEAATVTEPPDFSVIKGVSQRVSDALILAGIDTWEDLFRSSDDELLTLPSITMRNLPAIRAYIEANTPW